MNEFEPLLEYVREKHPEDYQVVSNNVARYEKHVVAMNKNYALFSIPTGKKYGDEMEGRIINSFADLKEYTGGTEYDAIGPGKSQVEIKSIRMCKKDDGKPLASRILNVGDPRKGISTSSFQQAKPKECDYFLLHLLYGNSERMFVVPSKLVSAHPGTENAEPGKIPLSKQHKDHPDEGQINIGQILKRSELFEVLDGEYSSGSTGKYSFEQLAGEVNKKMDKIGWKLG